MTAQGSSPSPRPRPPARPPLRSHVAVARLRRMIVNGHLGPGAPLFEPQLGDILRVSRTPVREALKILAAEGLVELRRNRSAIVAPLDIRELADLFEMETGIEGFAAGLAAERIRAGELQRLARLQQRMETGHASGARDVYIRVNQDVHRLIVASARNAVLLETYERLLARLQRARNLALATEGRADESIREHRAILGALEAHDGAAASLLMARHVARTGEIFFASFAPRAAAATDAWPASRVNRDPGGGRS